MPEFIEPKPTTYRGTLFRSRLEARWAVYLDHHPGVKKWAYEPVTLTSPRTGWKYTPDFLITFAKPSLKLSVTLGDQLAAKIHQLWREFPNAVLLEVKPKQVSTEHYLFLDHMANLTSYPLFCTIGDFHKGFSSRRMGHCGSLVGPNLDEALVKAARKAKKIPMNRFMEGVGWGHQFNLMMLTSQAAMDLAKNYRFDLR